MARTKQTYAVDRTRPPRIVDAVEFNLHLKPYSRFQLANGVDVYAIHAGAEEVLMLEWVFYAGNCFEQKNLVAASANFLLRNGTTRKSAFEINEHFEYYGSYLNRNCYNETATITLHCLSKHVRELLPVVRELITDSVMPQQELDIYRQNMKQRLRVNLKKSDFVASRLIDCYLFGETHPYGRYSTEKALDAIAREELVAFYEKYYRTGKFMVFAAGKLPLGLEKLLNEQFGDLPVSEISVPRTPPAPAEEKKFRVTNDPENLQGAIRLARLFPNRHHPDFSRVQVLNALFGGFFGSRLMSNIREEKGYTYGIHSYLQNHIQHSAWTISTEAGKEVCEATIREVYHEMERLRDEVVDEEELLLVRNYMMGGILGDLDGPFQILARWKNLVLNGLDEKYFEESIRIIKTITAAELRELADRYLKPEDFYELVVI
ncbi:MAG TPA: pitrilysin family protein [Chitinophagaceae bacterium]|nr:pitrilysin family protein [Chitinophagaceae bacterium]